MSALPTPHTIRNRRWLWFFALLLVAAPFVIAIPIWYNLQQQLTVERLAAAQDLWQEQGPRDYVVEYGLRLEYNPEPGGRIPERFTVRVRGGKFDSAVGPGGRELKREDLLFTTMEDLFTLIRRHIDEDLAAGGRRPFMIAVFGRTDGHVARYRRSVIRTRELFEVEVKLRPWEEKN